MVGEATTGEMLDHNQQPSGQRESYCNRPKDPCRDPLTPSSARTVSTIAGSLNRFVWLSLHFSGSPPWSTRSSRISMGMLTAKCDQSAVDCPELPTERPALIAVAAQPAHTRSSHLGADRGCQRFSFMLSGAAAVGCALLLWSLAQHAGASGELTLAQRLRLLPVRLELNRSESQCRKPPIRRWRCLPSFVVRFHDVG